MDHGTKTGVGDEPFTACVQGKVNRLFRTKITADTATFTLYRIYQKIFIYGIPSAQFPAEVTLRTPVFFNNCLMAALEIKTFSYIRVHNKMQICGIYICVTQNHIFR